MAIKIKFLGKSTEKMRTEGYYFNGDQPDTIVQEVEDDKAEILLNSFPDYFEVAGAKKVEPKVDHRIPHLKKDVKAESYETKDIKASEETKSEPEPESKPEPEPKKSTPKRKRKRGRK